MYLYVTHWYLFTHVSIARINASHLTSSNSTTVKSLRIARVAQPWKQILQWIGRRRYTITDQDPRLAPGEVPDFPAPTAVIWLDMAELVNGGAVATNVHAILID